MITMRIAPEIGQTVRLLTDIYPRVTPGLISFKLWDGTIWPDDRPRAATIVLKHPGALREMFITGTEKGLAEAFLGDHFDVEGDLEAACEVVGALDENAPGGWRMVVKYIYQLYSESVAARRRSTSWMVGEAPGGRKHSKARDRCAVSHHYDLSNDFYMLWLDSKMLYSCAYFDAPGDDLERAQMAKLDHINRKLRLRPGMRVLDIGCGWGGLAIYAAQTEGVHVTAVTLSQQQASLASARVRSAGLGSRVSVELKDYRDVDEAAAFDAIVSVGMAEHLGSENLCTYFRKVFSLLTPGGVFLNHAIGDGVRARPTRGASFIQDYVFPDSDLPRIATVLAAAEAAGFEVRDLENLREHYTLTLRHWVRRLEGAQDAAVALVGRPVYRLWRLYLTASAYGFGRGRLAVYQTLLSKPDAQGHSHLPLTRRDWYETR